MQATRTCFLLLLLGILLPAASFSQNIDPSVPYFTVLSPSSLRNVYSYPQYGYATFGNGVTNGDIYAELALPQDSLFCDSLPASNLTGKIVLIARGTCEFGRKVLNAQIRGAKGVIIYNRDETTASMGAGTVGNLVSIPSIMVPLSIGTSLRNAIWQGQTVRVSFSASPTGFGIVSGKVRYDQNQNCVSDGTEIGLPAWVVTAQGNGHSSTAVTDEQGLYTLGVDSAAVPYTLSSAPLYGAWTLCGNPPAITTVSSGQVITRDFAAVPQLICPTLRTQVSLSRLRRCFVNQVLVKVCNAGTEVANNAYVDVRLPSPAFEPISAASLPYTTISTGSYRFQLGNLDIGACTSFSLSARIACGDTTALGQTLCVEAQAHPDTLCTPVGSRWNGANVQVGATCKGTEVEITIQNKGNAPMASASEFIIIEDDVMFQGGNIQLSANGTRTIKVPANGSTWRIEATQVPYHPVPQNPAATIEGCTSGSGAASTGYHLMFPVYDPSPAFDRQCMEIIGAYDPNDKQGFPKGVGNDHLIAPNTEIEYLIRFQNTGTDTAFNIIIRDTLSPFLSPRSIVPGAASAKYQLEVKEGGILVFRFPNIQLVDSFTNERLSHGYVYFKIAQLPDLPDGISIRNKAGIYFDYNPPVITNETEHVVGYIPRVTSSTQQPANRIPTLEIYPNPVQPGMPVQFKTNLPEDTHCRIFDMQGRLTAQGTLVKNVLRLPSNGIPSGTYRIEMWRVQQCIGTSTLVVAAARE